jgi:hypothetical protein
MAALLDVLKIIGVPIAILIVIAAAAALIRRRRD